MNEVFGNNKSEIELHPEKPGLTKGYIYAIDKAQNELLWKPQYTDMVTLYSDYKKEWETKRFRNYHFIKEEDKPKTL